MLKNVLGVAEKSCFEKQILQMFVSRYPYAGINDEVYKFISGKRSIFKTKLSCTIHDMTRCRDVVDIFKKIEKAIGYKGVTNLYATWAKQDVESGSCPFEIAYDLPGTAVMDNDDFKDYTLTGANTAHHTNVMFVQPENQARADLENHRLVLVNQKDLKILSDQQNKVRPYKTIKKGVPPLRKNFNIASNPTKPMQVEQMMHFILRPGNEHEPIPPKEQTISSFAGFQARIQSKPQKSKPYYFLTLPTTPHKSEVHEVISRLADAVKERRMPFLQLVGDQPVDALISQLRNENSKSFEKILSILFLSVFSFRNSFHEKTQKMKNHGKNHQRISMNYWLYVD